MVPSRALGVGLALATLAACAHAHVARAQSAPPASAPPLPPSLGDESTPLSLLREAEQAAEAAATLADATARAGTALPEGLDAGFAARVAMPALAPRISPRMARLLASARNDPRARRALASWLRHAERYRARIEAVLAQERAPADLLWVVAAESDFRPDDVSRVGAVGLWQLMPETARSYGLRVDDWVDERRDVERSTRAAARFLLDLRARFGSWELALAAYNMGYNALLRAVRKYNSNDFELLASQEAGLPVETAHYVPRILSAAVVARNAALFGLANEAGDAPVRWEDVPLPRTLPLDALARSLALEPSALRALNPSLLRARTPLADAEHPFALHVPPGLAARAQLAAAQLPQPSVRPVRLRHGESLDELAAQYDTTGPELRALSGLARNDAVPAGAWLLAPDREPLAPSLRERPTVAVDAPASPPADRRRVFYRVGTDDQLGDVARALGVRADELAAWNALDPAARLQSGMWLQAYVAGSPSDARVWGEGDVELVRRDSDEFHDRAVARDGRVRVHVIVREGDTMESIAAHYGLTVGSLSRINRCSRHAALHAGEALVVYADPERLDDAAVAQVAAPAGEPGR